MFRVLILSKQKEYLFETASDTMRLVKRMRDLLKNDSLDNGILLTDLIDHVSDIVAIVDSGGRITRHSRSFETAVKDVDLAVIPVEFGDIIDEPSKFDYAKLLEYVSRENKPVIDFRLRTVLDSGETDSLLSIIPTASRSGSQPQLLHVLRSVNDNQAAGPDLGDIEKLTNIGKIAAGMAHELNTPLGSIILSAEHIQEAVEDQNLAREASRIKSRAEHCSKVVKQLLGYVRHDDQKPKKYNLLNIVNKVTDLVSSDVKRRTIELAVIEADGDAIVECNENQIEQLLFNLIANASHAIDNSGRIEISFRNDPLLHRIYIVVQDSGTGIPPENIPKIFDPFFTTKPGVQGTGLGLALCKKIVLEHGGDISVKSEVGEGTTFEIWMPLENE